MDARCLIVNAFMLASMERRTRGTGIYIYIYIYKNGMKRMMRRLEYRDRINRIVFAKFQRKFEGMIPRRRAS